MGRKVLLAICWLTISQALGEPDNKKTISATPIDNESAESDPRLYHKGPLTVYASAVPYTSYTLKGHSVLAAGSQHIPVKASSNQGLVNLRDSYGKYVQSHQSAYMPNYPQQFVALQDLPPHLAQPLVSAASPSFNFKAAPSIVYGPHSYKIQELQLPANQAAQFGTISQPLVYLNDLKSFAPHEHITHEVHTPDDKLTYKSLHSNLSQTSNYQSHHSNQPKNLSHQPTRNSNQQTHHSNEPSHHPNQQFHRSNQQSHQSNQQSHSSNQPSQHSNKQTYHSNQPTHQSNHQTYASTFQRLYDNPSTHETTSFVKDTKQQGSQNNRGQIQVSPAHTSVTAIVNGKKTVINLETRPPLPLLDLNLLEPLKFDNPLVPQLQHYLPKLKGATYHKLPSHNVKKGKNANKDFIITKTKSYDNGIVKGETLSEPKKYNKPQTQKKQSKPGITVKGYPNSGDYSYEINTPNHKETYNEQIIKYNKETNMKPVDITYNEHSGKEPEVYTFVHSSKEPLKVTHVEYSSENDGPKHIVYNLAPQEKEGKRSNKVNQPAPEESDDDSGEDSSESEEDGPEQNSHSEEQHSHNEPKYPHSDKHNDPNPKYNEQQIVHITPTKEYYHDKHNDPNPKYNEQQIVHVTPTKEYYHSTSHNSKKPKNQPETHYYVKSEAPSKPAHQNLYTIIQETPNFQVNNLHEHAGGLVYIESPKHQPNSDSRHLKAEHRAKNSNPKPPQQGEYQIVQSFAEPLNKHQVVQSFGQNVYQPIIPEYEEDIRILPTHTPHAAPIKVNPSQHILRGPTEQTFVSFSQPNNNSARESKNISPQNNLNASPQHYNFQQPHVQEKSKHIIIEKHEETPNEENNSSEQDRSNEENSEEDFETGYKNAAYGFPAYENVAKDIEKDIFDPDSYGQPHYHNDYNIEHSQFQKYQKENDEFPKFARLAYKDSRDNNQEDYFLDYATHNPESYADRMKSKVEYYKMFKKNRPHNLYGEENNKEQKSARFTIAPSFDFFKQFEPSPKQTKNTHVKYKVEPVKYAFDYIQEAPRDNRAFASRPTYSKYKTHFVEPQLQYGFEPITEPILFAESEMAAVASNNSPESENLGTRKKIYKEKWFMKKTTRNSKPS